jgi:hypothetical protein
LKRNLNQREKFTEIIVDKGIDADESFRLLREFVEIRFEQISGIQEFDPSLMNNLFRGVLKVLISERGYDFYKQHFTISSVAPNVENGLKILLEPRIRYGSQKTMKHLDELVFPAQLSDGYREKLRGKMDL